MSRKTPADSQAASKPAVAGGDESARPLVLERNEGELRTRRIHTDKSTVAAPQFLLKVSPKNNGSKHPISSVSIDTDGTLYGTASAGGYRDEDCYRNNGCGVVWMIKP